MDTNACECGYIITNVHTYSCKSTPKCDSCKCRIDLFPINHTSTCKHLQQYKCKECERSIYRPDVYHTYACKHTVKCEICKCRIDIPEVEHMVACEFFVISAKLSIPKEFKN